MKRILMVLVLVGWSAAGAATREEGGAPTLEELSARAERLQKTINQTRTPEARARLLEQLEEIRHQMGPTDASGRRVHPQAMWHDKALERLDGEIKRLSAEEPPDLDALAPAGLVRRARLQVRRIARACLAHGWRVYAGPPKYQVDAFGQYLVNNLPMLDGLLRRLSGVGAPAPGAGREGAAGSPRGRAVEAIAKMTRAADAMTETPSSRPEDLLPPLGTFVEGLVMVREVAEGLKAEPAAGSDADEGAGTGEESSEPPPLTDEEKQRLGAVRQAAADLQGPDWAEVGGYLERFAEMVEAGFTVAGARPKARELLRQTERAAEMARGLADTPLAPPEYVAYQRRRLAVCLRRMESPLRRADAYARLDLLWNRDELRRRVRSLGPPEPVARGLLRAYYVLVQRLAGSDVPATARRGSRLAYECETVVEGLERLRAGPPDDMDPGLRPCYGRLAEMVRRSAEALGAAATGEPEEALTAVRQAADRAEDLALLVRARSVIEAVETYRPPQGRRLYNRLVETAQGLTGEPTRARRSRNELQELVRPFEDLEAFPAPDPAHRQTMVRLLSRTYVAAVARLSRQLRAAINAAAAGNPATLRRVLRAGDLFALAHERGMAEKARLDRARVGNLVSFSVPEEIWKAFRQRLDRRLREMFVEYARGEDRGRWRTDAEPLETVYGPVAAAQRLTLDARSPGEPDLHVLLRNLERAAVENPTRRMRDGWTAGYHLTEAAVTALADLDEVAAWHRRQVRAVRGGLEDVDLAPPPAETPAGR